MFQDIKNFIKKGLIKLGLIKELKDLQTHKKINVDTEAYDRLSQWQLYYSGYLKNDSHLINVNTIAKKEQKRLLTANLPKLITKEMSSLIFNEKVKINLSDDNLQLTVDNILKDNNFYHTMQSQYEKCLALGGMIIKPFYSNNKIKLNFVSADAFFPTDWHNGILRGGFFVNHFKDGKFYYTHIEFHDWENQDYVIKNELYKSEQVNKIGYKVNLKEKYPTLEESITFKNFTGKAMFVYIKPNEANNFDLDSPLGISIYANALDTIDTIDRMIDSLNREFKLGKKRIIVPSTMIRTVVDSNGNQVRYFDAEDETYEAFNTMNEDAKIQEIDVTLRVSEHVQAIEVMLKMLASQTGFSSNAFSFENGGVKTATEVVSEQSKTFKTKKSHEVLLESALNDLVDIVVYLLRVFENLRIDEYEVAVHFDDSIAEDKNAENARTLALVQNGLMPKIYALMALHDITEEDAVKWLEIINKENQSVGQSDVDLFGSE